MSNSGEKDKIIDPTEELDPEVEAERAYALENGSITHTSVQKLPHRVKSAQADVEVKNGVVTVSRGLKNSRKSRSRGGSGGAKKDGNGGKFTWGNALEYGEEELDPADPNYDSESFDYQPPEVQQVTADVAERYVTPIILQFYVNGDMRDAVESLSELPLSRDARCVAVRVLFTLALDHKNDARELTSQLLAELISRRVFSQTDVERGLTGLLLEDVEELEKDCPGASTLIGNFLARAIADLVIETDFLDTLRQRCSQHSLAKRAITSAEASLVHKKALHDVWGTGSGLKPVRFLSKQMANILHEYLTGGDQVEAARAVRELNVPHFNHEIVFQAGVLAIESMHERSMGSLASLLNSMVTRGDLCLSAVEKGFDRLYAGIADLVLDLPAAYTLIEWWTKVAVKAGFLPTNVAGRCPQKTRKRCVSEGHDGKLVCLSEEMAMAHPLT